MADKLYNKIIYGHDVLIDLTSDTVKAEDVAEGKIFHANSGEILVGTSTKDADTSDADALDTELLDGKIAYVKGEKIVGTMPNRGEVHGVITDINEPFEIDNGYHDGSGTVGIDETEKDKLIPSNIKSGVSVLGVVGSYEGEAGKGQAKEVEPYLTEQTVLPDEGFDYLTEVKVGAIYYNETPNSANGLTVTIGKVAP